MNNHDRVCRKLNANGYGILLSGDVDVSGGYYYTAVVAHLIDLRKTIAWANTNGYGIKKGPAGYGSKARLDGLWEAAQNAVSTLPVEMAIDEMNRRY